MTRLATRIVLGIALAIALGLGGAGPSGQSTPDTVADHVAAAEAAGRELWPTLLDRLCAGLEQQGTTRTARGTASAPAADDHVPPPRDVWYRAPEQVFDNVYLFAVGDSQPTHGLLGVEVAAWAVTGSTGIVLIDTTFDYAIRDVVDGMRQLGLDPSQITDVLVTHGHGDHFGGVKYLQEEYAPRVYMGPGDWEIAAEAGYVGIGQPLPRRDRVANDGQVVSAGETAITVHHTPGHTPGTLSFLIPVRIGGVGHLAAFWGGTAIFGDVEGYAESARRFRDVATRAGADIVLSNHDWAVDFSGKIAVMKAAPGALNPFVVGTDGVRRFTQVAEHCARAHIAARRR